MTDGRIPIDPPGLELAVNDIYGESTSSVGLGYRDYAVRLRKKLSP